MTSQIASKLPDRLFIGCMLMHKAELLVHGQKVPIEPQKSRVGISHMKRTLYVSKVTVKSPA